MQIFARRELETASSVSILTIPTGMPSRDVCRERPLWRSAIRGWASPRPPQIATEGVPYRAGDCLLLEGSWPDGESHARRWSLDDAIDSRFAWIDRGAAEHAARLAQPPEGLADDENRATLAYLNELALRYFLVKLLRVVAFFDEVRRPARGEVWRLHLADHEDAVYAELFTALAERHGVELNLHWHGGPGPRGRLMQAGNRRAQGPELPASFSWRRWAAWAARFVSPRVPRSGQHAPRVILCGSPRILDPVCAELLARGCRVWWLYEEFAVRSWWKWRRQRVGQLICDGGASTSVGNALRGVPQSSVDTVPPVSEHNRTDLGAVGWAERSESHHRAARLDEVPCGQRWDSLRSAHPTRASGTCEVTFRGVSLGEAITCWLLQQATKHSARQDHWLERIGGHFRAVQPTVLVVDEDATPFKRATIAVARQHGARSFVVQHGAPCGPFGFAPPAADEICVWGESTREQLVEWGVDDSKIYVTGWPGLTVCRERPPWRSVNVELTSRRPAAERHRGRSLQIPISLQRPPRFLLLATVPPDDRRPDTVTFHLTSRSHAAMIDMACAAVSRFAGARLTIKLHPRSRDVRAFQRVLAGWPRLDVRLLRYGKIASLWAEADCVLSCASTAGIEAALAGAPVVQLLPGGSGDVLPADHWGLIGSARTLAELSPLIEAALVGGWRSAPGDWQKIAAETGLRAAAAIADRVFGRGQHPPGDARCGGIARTARRS